MTLVLLLFSYFRISDFFGQCDIKHFSFHCLLCCPQFGILLLSKFHSHNVIVGSTHSLKKTPFSGLKVGLVWIVFLFLFLFVCFVLFCFVCLFVCFCHK